VRDARVREPLGAAVLPRVDAPHQASAPHHDAVDALELLALDLDLPQLVV
jgi:hypothetical protein